MVFLNTKAFAYTSVFKRSGYVSARLSVLKERQYQYNQELKIKKQGGQNVPSIDIGQKVFQVFDDNSKIFRYQGQNLLEPKLISHNLDEISSSQLYEDAMRVAFNDLLQNTFLQKLHEQGVLVLQNQGVFGEYSPKKGEIITGFLFKDACEGDIQNGLGFDLLLKIKTGYASISPLEARISINSTWLHKNNPKAFPGFLTFEYSGKNIENNRRDIKNFLKTGIINWNTISGKTLKLRLSKKIPVGSNKTDPEQTVYDNYYKAYSRAKSQLEEQVKKDNRLKSFVVKDMILKKAYKKRNGKRDGVWMFFIIDITNNNGDTKSVTIKRKFLGKRTLKIAVPDEEFENFYRNAQKFNRQPNELDEFF